MKENRRPYCFVLLQDALTIIIWYFPGFVWWRVMDIKAVVLRSDYHCRLMGNVSFCQHLRENMPIDVAASCDESDTFSPQ
jgi:hypothetical protein